MLLCFVSFLQDYRHYKYFGFAGRGAKTSWAHNPKYKELYRSIISEAADANPPAVCSGQPKVCSLFVFCNRKSNMFEVV